MSFRLNGRPYLKKKKGLFNLYKRVFKIPKVELYSRYLRLNSDRIYTPPPYKKTYVIPQGGGEVSVRSNQTSDVGFMNKQVAFII